MQEIWKDIQGYEGLYQVSNLGNVKSLHFGKKTGCRNWEKSNSKILKSKLTTSGYYSVELYKPNSRKQFYIHRLVANTFIKNPYNKEEVNHIDGNKLNNHVENLEWVTKSENQLHAIKLGLRTPCPMYNKKGRNNPRSKPLIQYDLNGNFLNFWYCAKEASDYLNVKPRQISSCAEGKSKTAYGYKWKYVENESISMNI